MLEPETEPEVQPEVRSPMEPDLGTGEKAKTLLSRIFDESGELVRSMLPIALPAVATGIGIGMRYSYERGYCDYFGIPVDFISLELTDILQAGFASCLGTLFFFWVMKFIFIDVLKNVSVMLRLYLGFYAFILLPAALTFLFKREINEDTFWLVFFWIVFGHSIAAIWEKRNVKGFGGIVLLMLGLMAFLVLNWPTNDPYEKLWLYLGSLGFAFVVIFLQSQYPVSDTATVASTGGKDSPSDSFAALTFAVFYFTLIPLMLAFSFGFYKASGTEQFLVRSSDSKYILARTFGDRSFFCEVANSGLGPQQLTGDVQIATADALSNETLSWESIGSVLPRSIPEKPTP